MIKFIAICSLFFIPILIYGQSIITNPDLDYISSAKFPDDLVPKTDKVLHLKLDPYGSGKAIIFLSFRDFSDRSGNIWTAYIPVNEGYRRIDYTSDGNLIQFRVDGFYAIDPKGGLYVLYPGHGGGQLVHYDFKNGNATTLQIQSIDYGKSEDKQYVEKVLGHKLEDRSSENHPTYKILTVSEIKAETK
ncbi:MAG: hypothetical protein LV480_12535 [Methylacidiphilales bacterium]|nr:hypothetical protein [Candidatus Methylacidiphilales bacterium]